MWYWIWVSEILLDNNFSEVYFDLVGPVVDTVVLSHSFLLPPTIPLLQLVRCRVWVIPTFFFETMSRLDFEGGFLRVMNGEMYIGTVRMNFETQNEQAQMFKSSAPTIARV